MMWKKLIKMKYGSFYLSHTVLLIAGMSIDEAWIDLKVFDFFFKIYGWKSRTRIAFLRGYQGVIIQLKLCFNTYCMDHSGEEKTFQIATSMLF